MLAVLSLGPPLVGAYFPPRFHRYFKPTGCVTSWSTPSELNSSSLAAGVGLLVSGSKRFINGIMGTVGSTHRIIASVETSLRGATLRGLRKSRASAKELLARLGMQPVSLLDSDYGRATDACHVIGFGRDLASDGVPTVSKSLPLTLRHFLDGGAKGVFLRTSRVPRLTVPVIDDPPRSVLWHLDTVRGEGLFPCTRPRSLVYCPSHFFPGQWLRRLLTLQELLRLYRLPLSLDPLLRDLDPERGLPFEDAPAPDVFVSIFRQLWGVGGGVVLGPVSVETPNCGGSEIDSGAVEVVVPVSVEVAVAVKLKEDIVDVEKVDKAKRVAGAGPPSPPPSVMTADIGLETRGSAGLELTGPPATWQFELDACFGDSCGGLTDEDTVTSLASKETLAWASRGDKQEMGSYGVHEGAQRESLRLVEESKEFARAVKSDDAEIPIHLWNDRVRAPGVSKERRDKALVGLRKLGLRRFRKVLLRDCSDYLASAYGAGWARQLRRKRGGERTELARDQDAITSMLWHSTHTNWFEFKAGSRLVHFRFPARYRKEARDGVKVFFELPGPSTWKKQPSIEDMTIRARTKEKIAKVLKRRYLLPSDSLVKSNIKYFAVPKGDDDIRMVYDATANKLNEAVWVPTFWLPTIDSLVRAVCSSSWMTDRDVGDMFLNYQLHEDVRPFTGVDLTPLYAGPEDPGPRLAVWDRNLMGFAASPYNSIKMALVAEEICKGDRFETGIGRDGKELNPFQWDVITLNLPGSTDYDPRYSWIVKRRKDGQTACDLFTFVDDERVVGPSEELTWQASHMLASKQSYLGIQDAARKVRPCSQTAGAWAGAIVHVVDQLGVCVLTSKEKWSKMRGILEKWRTALLDIHQHLSHKELLSDRGFLVYVTRTYPAMVPYLKGFHLTIEMWRGGRDPEGWKLRPGSAATQSEEASTPDGMEDEDEAAANHRIMIKSGAGYAYAPEDGLTTPVPRFKDDINALIQLSNFDLPPLRVVRPTHVVHVYYGFGDASGKQFGATLSESYSCRQRLSTPCQNSRGVRFRLGLWTAEEEEESSNYKELKNLVDTVLEEARAGRLRDCEFFLFTDNSTAEGCFYRGNSKSRRLHALVLSLRTMEMTYGMTIHVIHISGKRMIAQGTDGCSRGSLMEGVMAGQDMLTYVDLSRGSLERHPPLLDWVRSWAGRPKLEPLTPEGWFNEGHGISGGFLDGNKVWIPTHCKKNQMFLWAPPPSVADAALEELLKSRHKRTDLFHVVVLPRLMAPRWRRLFLKVCDFTFVASPGLPFWPTDMFEPLWVGIVLPFAHCRPWSLKRAPLLVEMERDLRRVFETGEGDAGNILRKLLLLPKRLASLSQRVACGVLHLPWGHQLPDARDRG